MMAPKIDLTFPHAWEAEILRGRPLILPPRRFVYPREVEEVERGALEVMVRPHALSPANSAGAKAPDPPKEPSSARLKSCPDTEPENGEPFLVTCALGFRDPAAASGVWAAPNAEEICCVAGGYVYVIDTAAPEQFTFLALRPVLEVRAAAEAGLLLFVGHRTMVAWGREGQRWESEKLSDEGVTVTGMDGWTLHGMGWSLMTDKESAFALDLHTGLRLE